MHYSSTYLDVSWKRAPQDNTWKKDAAGDGGDDDNDSDVFDDERATPTRETSERMESDNVLNGHLDGCDSDNENSNEEANENYIA